jgi:hypothetical protein
MGISHFERCGAVGVGHRGTAGHGRDLGLFVSPKATRRMHDPVRLITEIAIFGIAAAACGP